MIFNNKQYLKDELEYYELCSEPVGYLRSLNEKLEITDYTIDCNHDWTGRLCYYLQEGLHGDTVLCSYDLYEISKIIDILVFKGRLDD